MPACFAVLSITWYAAKQKWLLQIQRCICYPEKQITYNCCACMCMGAHTYTKQFCTVDPSAYVEVRYFGFFFVFSPSAFVHFPSSATKAESVWLAYNHAFCAHLHQVYLSAATISKQLSYLDPRLCVIQILALISGTGKYCRVRPYWKDFHQPVSSRVLNQPFGCFGPVAEASPIHFPHPCLGHHLLWFTVAWSGHFVSRLPLSPSIPPLHTSHSHNDYVGNNRRFTTASFLLSIWST